MKKIFLDTNALMAIVELKIDIFSEVDKVCDFPYQLWVLQGTIEELKKIHREQRLRFSRAAQLVLSLLKVKKVRIVEEEGNVDDILTEYSQRGYLILTQDKELKRRLTRPYLTLRQRKMVVMVK